MEILWKLAISAEFLAIRPKTMHFHKNFRTRKQVKITVFQVVIMFKFGMEVTGHSFSLSAIQSFNWLPKLKITKLLLATRNKL